MGTVTRVIAIWLGWMLVVWLVATLIPGELSAGEVAHTSQGTPATPADVVLTVHEGVLSLWAQDASLKSIFDAIGRQLHIDVVARIPAEEQITIAFDQLSLVEALKRFRPYVNYMRSRMPRRHREPSGNSSSSRSVRQVCHRSRSRRTVKRYYHPSLGRAQPRHQERLNVPSHLPLSLIHPPSVSARDEGTPCVWEWGNETTTAWPASVPALVGAVHRDMALWAADPLAGAQPALTLKTPHPGAGGTATPQPRGAGSGRMVGAADLSATALSRAAVPAGQPPASPGALSHLPRLAIRSRSTLASTRWERHCVGIAG